MPEIGIIGGSGVYDAAGFELLDDLTVKTPYGSTSDKIRLCSVNGKEVFFLNRHGKNHAIAPHKVNYRANIYALKELGVKQILATGAVGGIDNALTPGCFVIVDQLIDMTKSRISTFYDTSQVYHIDFTEPYCPDMTDIVHEVAKELNIKTRKGGTYICTEGPRLETRAEIELFKTIGASVVGMTAMPEAVLARELELCYCTIAVVSNLAAGIVPGKSLSVKEVIDTMKNSSQQLSSLIQSSIFAFPKKRTCPCKDALKGAKL